MERKSKHVELGNQIICSDCLDALPSIESDSIDCIVTDSPYGLSFMGKNWDKAIPSIDIWKQCLRVLKPGAFAFVMCTPRQDCLSRMIINLEDAGFDISFTSIYWTYGSGMPKAQNISKAIDKRAGVERKTIAKIKKVQSYGHKNNNCYGGDIDRKGYMSITAPATPQAKALDGSYGGLQLKPAVEIIIVAMKPLTEKTFVDQAMSNRHGVSWLDDCRIPYMTLEDRRGNEYQHGGGSSIIFPERGNRTELSKNGRFPANVLCEDDVLNDGKDIKVNPSGMTKYGGIFGTGNKVKSDAIYTDSWLFSRYFSLDAWFAERIKQLPKEAQKTFPWLIVPKASKSEKNKGLEDMPLGPPPGSKRSKAAPGRKSALGAPRQNFHATVKPIKLMSWLITLGTREGDIVLDPFLGSGTTCIAAKMLGRQYIGIEKEEEYVTIAKKRIAAVPRNLFEFAKS